jgi:hypothetical protein
VFFSPFFQPRSGFLYLRFLEMAGAPHPPDDTLGGIEIAAVMAVGLGLAQSLIKMEPASSEAGWRSEQWNRVRGTFRHLSFSWSKPEACLGHQSCVSFSSVSE